jgi:ParB-like chromosome segregation protein Spo0J
MRIKIEQVIVDNELYPRNQMDWLTAYRYADAIQAGATFPPLVVGKKAHAFVLIDGRHRLDAYKRNDAKVVPCIVSRVPEREFLLEAIRLNAVNGRPLSVQERVQSAARLKAGGYSPAQISKALFISLASLERLMVDRVLSPPRVKGGLALVRKAAVPTGARLGSDEEQKPLAAASVLAILQQATLVFERRWVDLGDEVIAEQVNKLARALYAARRSPKRTRAQSA